MLTTRKKNLFMMFTRVATTMKLDFSSHLGKELIIIKKKSIEMRWILGNKEAVSRIHFYYFINVRAHLIYLEKKNVVKWNSFFPPSYFFRIMTLIFIAPHEHASWTWTMISDRHKSWNIIEWTENVHVWPLRCWTFPIRMLQLLQFFSK